MTELGPPNINRWFNVILINIFGAIWNRRNMCRFQDNSIPCKTSINTIISSVSFSVNYTTIVQSTIMSDFMILKSFFIKIHPPNAPEIKEMMWFPLVTLGLSITLKVLLIIVLFLLSSIRRKVGLVFGLNLISGLSAWLLRHLKLFFGTYIIVGKTVMICLEIWLSAYSHL